MKRFLWFLSAATVVTVTLLIAITIVIPLVLVMTILDFTSVVTGRICGVLKSIGTIIIDALIDFIDRFSLKFKPESTTNDLPREDDNLESIDGF